MKIKKTLAVILASAVIICSFASAIFSAKAKTQEIILNTEIINTTDGINDKNWYFFTPQQSGMYTFLSYNRYLYAEAYLFEVEGKNYNQLAYSNESPNYEYYSQPNKYQFCLSYNLEAGKTYYYAAGWDSERTSGEMKVKLIYEGDTIDYLEVECNAQLTWYTDGKWEKDEQGETYFYYNYSKIIQNMTLKVHYKNGSVSTASAGAATVDGCTINYTQNQSQTHWYPEEDEKYTANLITVSVLNKSVQYNVKINQSALFTYHGAVCDYISKEPVAGASISINGSERAISDENGEFSFASAPGVYRARVTSQTIIPRECTISVDVNSEKNDKTKSPIEVVNCDYVKDGIINAKDYSYIIKNFDSEKAETEGEKIALLINFTAEKYNAE